MAGYEFVVLVGVVAAAAAAVVEAQMQMRMRHIGVALEAVKRFGTTRATWSGAGKVVGLE